MNEFPSVSHFTFVLLLTATSADHSSNSKQCTESEQEWLPFFLSSVVTFVGGIVILFLSSIITIGYRRHGRKIPILLGSMVKRELKAKKVSTGSSSDPRIRRCSFSQSIDKNKVDWYSYIRELARELISAQRRSGRLLSRGFMYIFMEKVQAPTSGFPV
ncbi:hypothetical protein ACOME3_005909 [Neoechinorhynchus agilis]